VNTADDSISVILSTLRAASKRITVPKRAVAGVLVDATGDLTADEITSLVQERVTDVSTSTVYRILEEFEELGIVVHAHLGQTAAVYHLAGPVHGHLTCEHCGANIEIPASHFDALSKDLRRDYGFVLDRHHVAISGTCARCQRDLLALKDTPLDK